MYNIFLALLVLVFVNTMTCQAQEQSDKLYVRVDVGRFIPANKFKEKQDTDYITKRPRQSTVYNIGVGYAMNDNWRGDLNFNYRNLKYGAKKYHDPLLLGIKQQVKIYSLILNGYYDLNIHRIMKPYLVLGIGYSCANSSDIITTSNGVVSDNFPGKKINNLLWNAGIGTRFILNHRFNLDVSYRYINSGKARTKDATQTSDIGTSQKITSHDFTCGMIIHL